MHENVCMILFYVAPAENSSISCKVHDDRYSSMSIEHDCLTLWKYNPFYNIFLYLESKIRINNFMCKSQFISLENNVFDFFAYYVLLRIIIKSANGFTYLLLRFRRAEDAPARARWVQHRCRPVNYGHFFVKSQWIRSIFPPEKNRKK